MGDTVRSLFKLLLWVFGALLLVAGGLRLTLVTQGEIDHAGMAPSLHRGDQLLIWRGTPRPGSIAYCQHPVQENQTVVARVVASEGQKVEVVRGQLAIDGKSPYLDWGQIERLPNAAGPEPLTMQRGEEVLFGVPHGVFLRKGAALIIPPQTVPSGTLFLLSDNRSFARRDSRSFGAVSADRCIGTVWLRWNTAPEAANTQASWFGLVR